MTSTRLKESPRPLIVRRGELQKTWEKVPPDYYEQGISKNLLQRIWHTTKFETFKNLVGVRKFKKVLDVGCAGGHFTNQVSKLFPGSQIVGIDIYSEAIKFGKRQYPHIRFLQCDAHKLPFKDELFNLVICYETIEHVLDPQKVLKEMHRVLDNRGIAVVTMDSGSPLFRVIWYFWEKTRGKVWQGAHIHPFHHTELEREIKKAGFGVLKKKFSHLGMEVSFVLRKRY